MDTADLTPPLQLHPLHDNVLVEKLSAEQMTPAGVILPDHSRKSRTDAGVVLAVGPGKHLPGGMFVKPAVNPGDRVTFWKNAGSEVVVNGKDLLLVPYEQLLGVLS